ncbi:hypothetical protein ACF0H5_010214 [Mactra antiquata]
MAIYKCVTVLIVSALVTFVNGISVSFSTVEELQPLAYIGKISDQLSGNESKIFSGNLNSVHFDLLAADSSPDYKDYFSITSNSSLFLKQKVDRDEICPSQKVCVMKVVVFATNGTVTEFVNVDVTIEDINDNTPYFSQSTYRLDILEGSPIASSYELPTALDTDAGNNSIQHYVLSPSGTSFELDEQENMDGFKSLYLVLNLSLDRETWDRYQLYVEASDGGEPSYTGTLTVTINVTDINDNRPIFDLSEYNATIDEDIEINSEVVKISASDRDIGENSRLVYYFADSVTAVIRRYFGIEENTGRLYVKQKLDSTSGPFVLYVEAKDNGNPVKKNQVKVTINVRDKNDNAPQIQLSPSAGISVYENRIVGTHVALVLVTDEDQDLNGQVDCACLNNNFTVVKQSGASKNTFSLLTGIEFDREDTDRHEVVITCSDFGTPSLSSNISFIVNILDENDHTPVFSKPFYTTSVLENNNAGAVLVRVTASDDDIGPNGLITYEIQPFENSHMFTIESNTGIIKAARPFDREVNDTYTFTVIARDQGTERKMSQAEVTVDILDKNDNAPEFMGDSYAMSVMENSNISTSLGTVTATDPDLDDNGKISYIIPSEYSSYPFTILDDGTVVTTKVLDREKKASYHFNVVASDHGDAPQTSSIPVYVTVLDLNDNAPVIDFPYGDNNTVDVAHNTEPDMVIASVLAYDEDEKDNKKLTYSIIGGNSEELFIIGPDSGHIFLTKRISNGDVKQYTLTISVKDNGANQLETRETLHVRFYIASDAGGSNAGSASNGQNILIAIVISCVTFVLSVIIIVIICIIRRKDSKNHLYNAKSYDEQKIIQGHRSSNRSNSSKGSHDKMLYNGEKAYMENGYVRKSKKEVSFSVDEDQDTGISMETSGNFDPVSTFKSPSPVPSKSQDYENYQPEVSPPRSEKSDDTKQREIHRMTSLRVHQALIQSQNNNNNKQWPQSPTEENPRTYIGLTKRHNLDDSHSESSGEMTTSDSGRGGSEEDIRSNMTNSHDADESRSPNTSTSHPFYSSEARQPTFSSFHGNSVHKTGPILSSFLKQKQKRQQNEDVHKNMYPMNDLSNPHRNNLYNQYRLSGEVNPAPNLGNVNNGQPPNKLDFDPLLHSSKQSNLNYRNSFEEGSVTNRSQDDDNTTTTSGSYTINDLTDDFPNNDTKDMFYKPDTFV